MCLTIKEIFHLDYLTYYVCYGLLDSSYVKINTL